MPLFHLTITRLSPVVYFDIESQIITWAFFKNIKLNETIFENYFMSRYYRKSVTHNHKTKLSTAEGSSWLSWLQPADWASDSMELHLETIFLLLCCLLRGSFCLSFNLQKLILGEKKSNQRLIYQSKEEVERKMNNPFRLPGTKWCGDGDVAAVLSDLGGYASIDRYGRCLKEQTTFQVLSFPWPCMSSEQNYPCWWN